MTFHQPCNHDLKNTAINIVIKCCIYPDMDHGPWPPRRQEPVWFAWQRLRGSQAVAQGPKGHRFHQHVDAPMRIRPLAIKTWWGPFLCWPPAETRRKRQVAPAPLLHPQLTKGIRRTQPVSVHCCVAFPLPRADSWCRSSQRQQSSAAALCRWGVVGFSRGWPCSPLALGTCSDWKWAIKY